MLNPFQKRKITGRFTSSGYQRTHYGDGGRTIKPAILEVFEKLTEPARIKQSGRAKITLCPFHADKNPSFALYEDTNSYFCFTCQEKGDTFNLIEKILGVDFVGAKAWARDNHLIS